MNESKLFKSLVAIFVVIVLGGPAVVLADTPSHFGDANVTVSYVDLNLESEKGVQTLYKRLQPAQDETIDEITVYGTKSLNTRRIELHRAEEKVFAMFNELNLDDAYDIHCEEEIPPIGSLIKRRLCAPNFLREVSTEQDRFLWNPHVGGEVKSIPKMNKNLKKKMDALVAEQPEFRETFMEYETAKELYEDKHREDE